jgi:DNA-binding NarL/FixJ family response regulator
VARILIADDHAVVRAGYQPFLDADPSTSLVGEAASGSETIAQLRRSEWDLLLLDIHMPDRNGLDVLALVTSGYPKVRTFFSAPEEQVRLAAAAAAELAAGRPVETAALVVCLRDFIRQVSDLQPVPSQLLIPKQGPSRATPSKGGKEGEKNGAKQSGGSGLGSGAGGAGLGGGFSHDEETEHHD